MTNTTLLPFQRRLLLSLVVTLLALGFLVPSLSTNVASSLDACVIDRSRVHPRTLPMWLKIGDSIIHNATVAILWIAAVLAVIRSELRESPLPSGQALFELAFATLWFHGSYWFLYVFKALRGDIACNGPSSPLYPNGLSGHYAYFGYCLLGLPLFQLHSRSSGDQGKAYQIITPIMYILDAVFAVGAAITLYRTYMHGYHSARQVFLGAALGVCTHVIMYSVLTSKTLKRSQKTGILGGLCLSGFVLTQLTWPSTIVGKAIGPVQIGAHVAVWGLLLYLSITVKSRKTNVE